MRFWTRDYGEATGAAWIVMCIALMVGSSGAADAAVTCRSDVGGVTLANQRITLRVSPTGRLSDVHTRGGENLLAHGGVGYWNANSDVVRDGVRPREHFVEPGQHMRVVRQSDALAEVVFEQKPTDHFPFAATLHYVLRDGESGFYLYMTLDHEPGMAAAYMEQYSYTLRLDPKRFDYIAVDDERQGACHTCAEEAAAKEIMNATYRLADGRVVSKYNYCVDLTRGAYHVYGWAGDQSGGAGVWLVQPSGEYFPSAPFKQTLSAHQTAKTPVIVWQAHCSHFGSPTIRCTTDESWHKLYGPAFVYVNDAADAKTMWDDAKAEASKLGEQWPYAWMHDADYPQRRATVTGRMVDGPGHGIGGAWVVLSPAGSTPEGDVKGYHYWARSDATGAFAIDHVRPGRYTLTAEGADHVDRYTHEVDIEQNADLGELSWPDQVHGRRVWQIGRFDRSAGEFRNGDDYRHWGLWRRYPVQFPGGVHFVVGQSDERHDWNFAQWNWTSGDPAWRITFDMAHAPTGKAYLTIGVTAARPTGRAHRTDLRVSVDDHAIGAVQLPDTGAAGYRSGRGDTPYHVVTLTFDASLLHAGRNTIALRHAQSTPYAAGDAMGESGSGPGYVMYDALRLEIEPPHSNEHANTR